MDKNKKSTPKKRGRDYLVALYNLHLPDSSLSVEDRKRLHQKVWQHFQPPPLTLNSPSDNVRAPNTTGYIYYPDGGGRGFYVGQDMMDYFDLREGNLKLGSWWKSDDFLTLQENYQHLRKCVEGLVEGRQHFDAHALDWLNQKIKSLASFEMVFIGPLDEPWETLERHIKREGKSQPIVLPRRGHLVSTPVWHDLLPSDLILHQAYIEIIDVINKHRTFRRCKAPDCHNLFYSTDRKRKFCSQTCAEIVKRAGDNESKADERLANYQEMARWLAQLPQAEELDAIDIALMLDERVGRRLGLQGHQVGRRLGIRQQKEILEQQHGITYERQHTGRQYSYIFRRIQL